ncbi:MAG: hypothetical protein AAGH68_09435 [Pseudomonadota bacterium]
MTTILIAQPTTGTVVTSTVAYLMALAGRLSAQGVGWGYQHLSLSDIALSRNIFASHVLASDRFTHLLFIDSDMGFHADTIVGLLELDRPVVACACPKRHLGWDTLRDGADSEADDRPKDQRRSTPDLIDTLLDYNVDTSRFDGSPWEAKREGRFLSVPAVGTGIMLIRRDVFETMRDRDVAPVRSGYKNLPLVGTAALHDFFGPIMIPDGSLTESEDISFCKRWVEDCGGEIWADIESRILHFGMRGHSGRYLPRALMDFPEIADG